MGPPHRLDSWDAVIPRWAASEPLRTDWSCGGLLLRLQQGAADDLEAFAVQAAVDPTLGVMDLGGVPASRAPEVMERARAELPVLARVHLLGAEPAPHWGRGPFGRLSPGPVIEAVLRGERSIADAAAELAAAPPT